MKLEIFTAYSHSSSCATFNELEKSFIKAASYSILSSVTKRLNKHFKCISNLPYKYELLSNEDLMDKEILSQYAKKHSICPFELSLDASLYADLIVCDYNYVFDPRVYLKRFFMEKGNAAPIANRKKGNTRSTQVIPGNRGLNT